MAKHDRPGRNEQTVFGVAWFDREQWRHLEQVVANRIELDDTFEQWEQSALKALRKFEAEGSRCIGDLVQVRGPADRWAISCEVRGTCLERAGYKVRSNNAFERTVGYRGSRLAAAQRWCPAAQLGR